jgi:hypothetical protein
MPTFTSFANILPDPVYKITDAGNTDAAGSPGPGFSAVGMSSVTDTQVSRTVSGRGVSRDGGSQHWEFTISYNPMFRDEFDAVDAFLAARNPRRDPFYVILPQYSKPKSAGFNALIQLAGSPKVDIAALAGSNQLIMNIAGDYTFDPTNSPRPGDMFTITDPNNFNHQKVYKVAGVETNLNYQVGSAQPLSYRPRLRFAPPLERNVSAASTLNFINPKFRVIAKSDVQEHNLNTDNLYSFSLPVEEIQP